MKKIYALLSLTLLTLFSCSKSDDSPGAPTNQCGAVNSFSIAQQNENVVVTINSSTSPLYYELSYQSASSNPNPDYGSKLIINGTTATFSINSLGFVNGGGDTVVFFVRPICSSSSAGSWSSASALTIAPYCSGPSNLIFSSNYLSWDGSSNNSNYQVQYGPTGFSLGSGTTYTTTTDYYTGFAMQANSSYDFYVRSFCSNSSAWSSWIGPYTHLNTVSTLCNQPTNLSRQIVSTTSQYAWVTLQWSHNGETNFEYMVVLHSAPISGATIYSATNAGWPTVQLTRSLTYDFYMRTVCSDGTRTAWTAPYLISNL